MLPFAEDVREFQFPSFNNVPASWQPNEQQQEAADNLVKMLDLAPHGKEEALLPDFTPNPVLQVLMQFHGCIMFAKAGMSNECMVYGHLVLMVDMTCINILKRLERHVSYASCFGCI